MARPTQQEPQAEAFTWKKDGTKGHNKLGLLVGWQLEGLWTFSLEPIWGTNVLRTFSREPEIFQTCLDILGHLFDILNVLKMS